MVEVGRPSRTAQLSTAYSGAFAVVHLGATFRPNMAVGTRSIVGSDDGVRPGVWETVAVTLAEIMADSGHYSIDSTTVRAHVSAAGGKGGLIDALLAARGAGSPVSFTAWPMPSDDRSPSTLRSGKRQIAKPMTP